MPPGSRGMHASEHLQAAQDQDELASQDLRVPDVHPGDLSPTNIPWTRVWDTSTDHARLATIHRGAAAQLQAEFDEACGKRDVAEISTSPLTRYVIGGESTVDGAVFYLSLDAGPPERLLADMRCHRAWMMLASSDMDDCPLDLAGIEVDVRGDMTEITVEVRVKDPLLVDELHRRAHHELGMAELHTKPVISRASAPRLPHADSATSAGNVPGPERRLTG